MKSDNSELSQRYLVLIKIDSYNLFKRISERYKEYMEVFSLKRDRSIFKEIFFSRYQRSNLSDLSYLPIEIIELANSYYEEVDNLFWYLKYTQDMPNTIEDEILREIAKLKKLYETLILYIDAELSGQNVNPNQKSLFETLGEQEDQESMNEYLQPRAESNDFE